MPPKIEFADNLPSSPEQQATFEALLQAMFPTYDRLIVEQEFSQNSFSGSWVFLVQRVKTGRRHLPVVVKIAARSLIEQEWRAYGQYIRERWPATAPIKAPPVAAEDLSGLFYDVVGEGIFPVTSFRAFCLAESTTLPQIESLLKRFTAVIDQAFRFSQKAAQVRLGALYDRLLPVNLLLVPLPESVPPPAPQRGEQKKTIPPSGGLGGPKSPQTKPSVPPTTPTITPTHRPTPPPEPGAVIRLEGFAVTKVDLKYGYITLNLPPPAEGQRLPGDAYTVRFKYAADQPLPAYAVGQIMPPTKGRLLDTRRSQWQAIIAADLAETGVDLTAPRLALPDGGSLPNPFLALPALLNRRIDLKVDAIHGDLNVENILVDPDALDLRLIDFAEARWDHVLHDFLRLETEIVAKLIAPLLVAAERPLSAIRAFYEQLHTAAFERDSFHTARSPDPTLLKPFALLKTIRALGRRYGLLEGAPVADYYRCLIIYLLGALKFSNLNRAAKQTALWGAATLLDLLDSPPPAPPQPGQRLNDRYQIDNILGVGGMGAVFKGQDLTLARDIAIKIMHPAIARQPELQARFRREAQTAAQLNHPGIVQVYDYGQSDDLLYIIMEYVPGDNLQRILTSLRANRRWLRLVEAVAIVRQVCQALEYAHRQGVLHRDLKPSNVMLKAEASDDLPYRPVVADLGLAKLLTREGLTMSGAVLGTPAYVSPEQALGRPLEPRSDIYALGILLYELMTGQPPFPAVTMAEAAHYHPDAPLPEPRSLRPDLPPAVEQVITRALAKRPADRFPDAAAMADALAATLETATQVMSAPPGLEQPVSLMTRAWADEVTPQPPEIAIDLPPLPPAAPDAAPPGFIQGDVVPGSISSGDNNIYGLIEAGTVQIGHYAQMYIGGGQPADDPGDLARLFSALYHQIETRPADPDVERAELRQLVERIEQAVTKEGATNPNKLTRWLRDLARLAPDVGRLALAGLAAPTGGAAPAIRRLAAKLRPEMGDG